MSGEVGHAAEERGAAKATRAPSRGVSAATRLAQVLTLCQLLLLWAALLALLVAAGWLGSVLRERATAFAEGGLTSRQRLTC